MSLSELNDFLGKAIFTAIMFGSVFALVCGKRERRVHWLIVWMLSVIGIYLFGLKR